MAAETFDICSEFPATRLSVRAAASTPDGSPIVRSRTIVERELRIFTLNWSNYQRMALVRLKQLWRDIGLGPSQAMNFTPQGESAIEVRFRQGSLSYTVESATSASFSVELEEVR